MFWSSKVTSIISVDNVINALSLNKRVILKFLSCLNRSIANNSNAAITVTATSDGSTAADIALGNVRGHGDDEGANVVAGVDILTFVHNKATAGDQAMYISDGCQRVPNR